MKEMLDLYIWNSIVYWNLSTGEISWPKLRSEFNIMYKRLRNKTINTPVLYKSKFQWSLASGLEFDRSLSEANKKLITAAI